MWGGWLTGPDGTDYVALESDVGIKPRMGRGVLGDAPDSLGGNWRDVWAIPLAFVRGFLDCLVWNANPGTAEDLLPEWEDALGVPRGDPSRYTIAERQERVQSRLRREIGPPTTIALSQALGRIQYEAGFTDEVPVIVDDSGNAYYYFDAGWMSLVTPLDPAYDPQNPHVVEALNLLWRFSPAGISIGWYVKP